MMEETLPDVWHAIMATIENHVTSLLQDRTIDCLPEVLLDQLQDKDIEDGEKQNQLFAQHISHEDYLTHAGFFNQPQRAAAPPVAAPAAEVSEESKRQGMSRKILPRCVVQ